MRWLACTRLPFCMWLSFLSAGSLSQSSLKFLLLNPAVHPRPGGEGMPGGDHCRRHHMQPAGRCPAYAWVLGGEGSLTNRAGVEGVGEAGVGCSLSQPSSVHSGGTYSVSRPVSGVRQTQIFGSLLQRKSVIVSEFSDPECSGLPCCTHARYNHLSLFYKLKF